MDVTDIELLQRYTRDHAEDAFAEILRRHLPLVHSSAVRQVHSTHLAEEIAQTVFLDLARKAPQLALDTILPAWLYEVTRRASIDVIRRETRRQHREQTVAELQTMHSDDTAWRDISPLIDEAMHSLEPADRAAVLLRFFENKSLRDIGATLGASENAAQKRIARALDRLHDFFTRRGVKLTASILAGAISANAVQAAPAHLAASIAALAGCSTSATVTATATAFQTIAMTTAQKAILATAFAVAISVGVYEARQASQARAELQRIQQQHAPGQADIAQQGADRIAAETQIAALQTEIDQLRRAAAEVPKLRAEVARLKSEIRSTPDASAPAATEFAAKTWLARVDKLRQRIAATPETNVPELRILNEEDWLGAVQAPELESDEDYRRAMSSLRKTAHAKIGATVQTALNKFLKENNATFPTDLLELRGHLDNPLIDDAILQQFEIVDADRIQSVKVGGKFAITQKHAIDEKFDSRIVIGPDGWGSSTWAPLTTPRDKLVSSPTPTPSSTSR